MAFNKELWVDDGSTVSVLNGDCINTFDSLPVGTYKVEFSKFRGFYLNRQAPITAPTEKIYGNSKSRAQHVVDWFNRTDRNVGVLLSGKKGVGKSYMSRLICSSLSNKPIIIVDNNIPGLTDWLRNIKDSVIFMDEFEKVFSTNDERANDPQEEFLTLLDGVDTVNNHNLFILCVNKKYKVNDYLLNRPGRIRYHYTFDSPSSDELVEYCKDNVENYGTPEYEEFETSLRRYVGRAQGISYDIISAVVSEYNTYKSSFTEILDALNVAPEEDMSYQVEVVYQLTSSGMKYFADNGMKIPNNNRITGNATMDIDLDADCVYHTYLNNMGRIGINPQDLIPVYNGWDVEYNCPTSDIEFDSSELYSIEKCTLKPKIKNRNIVFLVKSKK